MKYYTKQHEWFDYATHKVGLSNFAKSELGDIVYLKLPEIGSHVKAGDELLESTKAASDLYAPYDGTVTAINQHAIDFINDDPESKGWLVEIKPAQTLDKSLFLDQEAYLKMLET